MLIVSGFELIFCYSYIGVLFFRGFLFHSCLVYHSLLEALAFEWARFFIPAVASLSLFFFYLCRFKDCLEITENEFKTRYYQHTSSFRLNHKKPATTLSEFIWKLKESKTEYHLSWDVIERAQPYSAATNSSNLCIAEKYFILKTKPSLNKRREIFSSCPHRKKHLQQNYQWPGNENKQQHKVGTATKYTSVIPEESGGQATPLSSA